MNRKIRANLLVIVTVLVGLILNACGDPTATTAPATATLAATPTATTTATTTTVATTPAATTVAASPTPTPLPVPGVTPAWVKEGVCYEIFVYSFFDSNGDGIGDLPGLISKLDYLNDGKGSAGKSLNVNCIWLMPVTASPTYHGYDTTDFYNIRPEYGTKDDFKKLIQEAHRRGIYVLVDMMFNHTSIFHPWFQEALGNPDSPYRKWYIFSDNDPGYSGPLGKAWHKNPFREGYYYGVFDFSLPDLNLQNPDVTRELYKVTEFWIKEMGVDGFRMDAVKHFVEDGQKQLDTPQTKAWLREYRKFYTSLKPDFFTVGEIAAGSSLIGYYPDQMEQYFEFTLAQGFINSAKIGQPSFVNLVKDANGRWPNQRYSIFLTNHDQNRVMDALLSDMSKMKLATTAYLTSPGLPFIYYGEEIGMLGSKPDPDIRTPMQWEPGEKGGFTTGKPWAALKPDVDKVNVKAQENDPNSLLNLYRKLVNLRRANSALSQGDYLPLNSNKFTVGAFLRSTANSDLLVILNMSDEEVTDLKLTAEKSGISSGQLMPQLMFALDGSNPSIALLTVQAGGGFTDYAPLLKIPPRSAFILKLR
jgi:glycosidase